MVGFPHVGTVDRGACGVVLNETLDEVIRRIPSVLDIEVQCNDSFVCERSVRICVHDVKL